MSIDERCDPEKNAHFAEMLTKAGFDYADVNPIEVANPTTSKVSAVILPKTKGDIVLILLPGLGTSVLEHKKEISESVHYLGPVGGARNSLLFYTNLFWNQVHATSRASARGFTFNFWVHWASINYARI